MDTTCPYCDKQTEVKEGKCKHCGYPIQGTDKEQAVFKGKQIAIGDKIDTAKKRIKIAIYVLLFIGGLTLLKGSYGFFKVHQNLVLYLLSILSGLLFIVLGVFGRRQPLLSISIGLIVLIAIYTFQAVYFSIEILFSGIIWKMAYLFFLVIGLYSVYTGERLKKQYKRE